MTPDVHTIIRLHVSLAPCPQPSDSGARHHPGVPVGRPFTRLLEAREFLRDCPVRPRPVHRNTVGR
jgi:hypothetical protein